MSKMTVKDFVRETIVAPFVVLFFVAVPFVTLCVLCFICSALFGTDSEFEKAKKRCKEGKDMFEIMGVEMP